MTQIQFYHLTSTPFERALPKLLEKAVEAKYRVQLVVDSEERLDYIDQLLWTANPGSFLAHGTHKDSFPELQPVFIATTPESPNKADLLFVTEGTQPAQPKQYKRIIDMFDGHSDEAVAAARERWKHYKAGGFEASYFKQNDQGNWEKAA